MKIILFGNLGQVGREITEAAVLRNISVAGFDINNIDITHSEQVAQAFFSSLPVDIVINAAAYTAVDKAEDEEKLAFAVNRDAVCTLARLCKQHKLPLLHISTDYVFDGNNLNAYTEEATPNPLGVYGKSKLAGDLELQKILPEHVILRVSWVFGQYGNNFVKTILRLAQDREELKIVADQYGAPTAAADIARVLLDLAEKIHQGERHWGIYNYCNKPATTWYDFAENIVAIGRSRFPIKINKIHRIATQDYPTRAKRPQHSELLVAKIIEKYGIVQRAWRPYLETVIHEIVL